MYIYLPLYLRRQLNVLDNVKNNLFAKSALSYRLHFEQKARTRTIQLVTNDTLGQNIDLLKGTNTGGPI